MLCEGMLAGLLYGLRPSQARPITAGVSAYAAQQNCRPPPLIGGYSVTIILKTEYQRGTDDYSNMGSSRPSALD
jgi:hypothetical protein